MPKDIKKIAKDYQEENIYLSANHAKNFEKKLMQELHQTLPKRSYTKWLAAASVALLLGLGISFNFKNSTKKETVTMTKKISLGSLSPELNTIETYYKNSITYEMSQVEMTDENKVIIDGYLTKIKELSKEYTLLTNELNTNGVSNLTINALIRNLQLRLQLLQRLKKQLNDLKTQNIKENEITSV